VGQISVSAVGHFYISANISGQRSDNLERNREMLLEICTMIGIDPMSLRREDILAHYPER